MDIDGRLGTIPLQRKSQGAIVQDFVEMLWRRKWLLVLPLLLGLAAGYAMCFVLPPSYRSSTLILVEPQKVPSSYVTPTVTSTVDDRLRTISQQIMSRTNLSKIIREYNLYKSEEEMNNSGKDSLIERGKESLKKLAAKFGLHTGSVAPLPNQDEISEAVITRMRRDIDVRVTGKEAFSVAYNGKDPGVVMRVTNTLALLFIEENLKVRERQAEGTSEFLESQVSEVEKELQRQEQNLRRFQQEHRGALPSQLDANLRTLDRLQQELASVNDLIRSTESVLLEERKAAEERKAPQGEVSATPPPPSTPSHTTSALPAVVSPTQVRLEASKQDLIRLRATFNETYPDVVALKKQIEDLEVAFAAEASAKSAGGTGVPSTDPARKGAASTHSPAATVASTTGPTRGATPLRTGSFMGGVEKIERDLAGLRIRREKVVAQTQKLEEHVIATPANEERLTELTRDYGMSLKNYQGLLEKRLQAKISENLEKKQKGEQFRILDPANFPTIPSEPNPSVVVGIGGAIGGGLGVGLILLLNLLHPALRKPEDIAGAFGVPVLVTIPRYDMDLTKAHRLIVLHEADSFAAEQYRVLYTKINDLTKDSAHKILAITSAVQSEGKTVTALNLAVVMAKDFGKKTLVLEGDFRRPTIPLYLNMELEEGLVDILSSKADLHATMVPMANALVPFADDNLAVLPAVRRTQNSTSLLSSPRMRDLCEVLREQYDFILIDAPPILPLSDMNVFEEVVDGVIMVVRSERTTKDAVARALETLGTDKVLGIVLNDFHQPSFSYDKYLYGYDYSYKPSAK